MTTLLAGQSASAVVLPLVVPGHFGHGSSEPFCDIMRYFRQSNASESKRLFTLKRFIAVSWPSTPP